MASGVLFLCPAFFREHNTGPIDSSGTKVPPVGSSPHFLFTALSLVNSWASSSPTSSLAPLLLFPFTLYATW